MSLAVHEWSLKIALWVSLQYVQFVEDLLDQPCYLGSGKTLGYNQILKHLSKEVAWVDSVCTLVVISIDGTQYFK